MPAPDSEVEYPDYKARPPKRKVEPARRRREEQTISSLKQAGSLAMIFQVFTPAV